jgi:hypothetical protein
MRKTALMSLLNVLYGICYTFLTFYRKTRANSFNFDEAKGKKQTWNLKKKNSKGTTAR